MLITSTKIAAPRKEAKPIGVTPTIPSTIISQPSHFGKAPLRITEIPVAHRKANTPSMIGRKSLSQRACSDCTAIGSMSSAASASAKAIVPSIANPSATSTRPMNETSDSISPSPAAARNTLRR